MNQPRYQINKAGGTRQPQKDERVKWAFAGVLAFTLCVVLVWNGSSRTEPVPDVTTIAPETPAEAPRTSSRRQRVMPTLSLEEVIANNPFLITRELETKLNLPSRDPAVEEVRKTLVDVRERQRLRSELAQQYLDQHALGTVSLIFSTGDQHFTVIGSKTVREGETIDGLRIVSISPDGVTVEVTDEVLDQHMMAKTLLPPVSVPNSARSSVEQRIL